VPIAAQIAAGYLSERAWKKIKFRYKTNTRALARASTVTGAGAEETGDLFTAAICGYATSAAVRALPASSPLSPLHRPPPPPPAARTPFGDNSFIWRARARIGDVFGTLAANLSWILIRPLL